MLIFHIHPLPETELISDCQDINVARTRKYVLSTALRDSCGLGPQTRTVMLKALKNLEIELTTILVARKQIKDRPERNFPINVHYQNFNTSIYLSWTNPYEEMKLATDTVHLLLSDDLPILVAYQGMYFCMKS